MDRQGNLSRTEAANCRRSAVARRDDRGLIAVEPDDLQSVRRGPIDLQTGTSRDLIEFMMHRLREALRQGSFDVPMGNGGAIAEVWTKPISASEPVTPKASAEATGTRS